MIHHTTAWVPQRYDKYFNILSHVQQEFANDKKTIFFSHGAGDMLKTVESIVCDYYFCWTKEEAEHVRRLGGKAYYVGSCFIDNTIPENRNPRLLVYCPQHVSFRCVGIKQDDIRPICISTIIGLMKQFDCEDYVVSVVDDTDIGKLRHVIGNLMYSNRYDGPGHEEKCKYLYENAKIIYTDMPSTFTQTAQSFGISCIGDVGTIMTTPTKPNCMSNMIKIMDHIIKTKLTN